MSNRAIIVDDSDPLVHYTGPDWFQDAGSQDNLGNFGPPFLHTLHGTNSNSSFSFSFQGSSINVIGTSNLVQVANATGRFDPSWECFVDNISIGADKPFQYAENNWPLCGQQLVDGPHVITLNVIQSTAAGRTFWLDNIKYTPSSNVSRDNAYVLVDSLDPAIVFGKGWNALGNGANFTTKTGTELRFNFTGNGLSWFGYIPTELAHNATSATYAIDGGDPVTFHLNGLPQGPVSTSYNQLFFSTPELPAGPHSLHVIHGGTEAETPLTLDYLVVTATSSSPNTSSPVSTPQSQPHSQPQSPNSHKMPVGAVVGAVVGGIFLIVLGVVLLLWRRRRRRGVQLDRARPTLDDSPLMVATYGSSLGLQDGGNISHSSYPVSTSPTTDPRHFSVYPSPITPDGSPTTNSVRMSPLETSQSGASLSRAVQMQADKLIRLEYSPSEPVIHQDSGRRFHRGENMIEVPPGYSAD